MRRGAPAKIVWPLALAAVAALPWLPGVPPFWATLLDTIGIAAIVAVGLVVLTGIGGMTSFGQASFMGFGAYATAILTARHGWSPWATLPASLAAAGLAARAIGAVTLRLSGHYLALGTLASGVSLYYVFANLDLFGRNDGISGLPPLTLGPLALLDPRATLAVVAVSVALVVLAALLTIALGVSSLLDWKLAEKTTSKLVYAATVTGLFASIGVLGHMLFAGTRHVAIVVGDWVVIPHLYHFSVKIVFDRLSVPFAILSYVLSGTIGAFATKYMHRERGFNRFFMLYSLFVLGMVVTSLAGTIETLFTGWELVGLSSALLVAFFQERPSPARNGLWVWVIYRVSDASLLLAAVVMHHLRGEGDFDQLLGTGAWPFEYSSLGANQALLVGLLLLVAAAGKSALIPFSGWLPRAMEGPTPSSAVFYGALSVHLGAFLLLRVSPLLDRSLPLCVAVVALGLSTAVFAYLAASVQTDVKSALSFASLSQVGIIVAEIGLGFRYVALVHLLGHASLRTLQFVRAPSLLQDYRNLEDAIGQRLPQAGAPLGRRGKSPSFAWLYRMALERGYLDAMLVEYVVFPFVRAFRWCDTLERRWTDFLSGGASRESDQVKPRFGTIEEFS